MSDTVAVSTKQNDIHGMDPKESVRIRETSAKTSDKSYSLRDLLKEISNSDDLDALVCVRFRNCDPIIVTDVTFEEGQVVLEGEF